MGLHHAPTLPVQPLAQDSGALAPECVDLDVGELPFVFVHLGARLWIGPRLLPPLLGRHRYNDVLRQPACGRARLADGAQVRTSQRICMITAEVSAYNREQHVCL